MKIFVKHLNEDEIKELKEDFEAIDTDKNGFVTIEEMETVLKNLGYNKTKEELQEIFA